MPDTGSFSSRYVSLVAGLLSIVMHSMWAEISCAPTTIAKRAQKIVDAFTFICVGCLHSLCTRHCLCKWQPISLCEACPTGNILLFSLFLGYKNSRNQIAPIAAIDMIMNYFYNASKIFLALASTRHSNISFSDLIRWALASSKLIRHRPAFLLRIGRARS